jgi:uncharacterized protein YjbI with pentapeptide repeats
MAPIWLAAAALAAATPSGQSCQAALGPLYEGAEEADLPGRVDGATLSGPDALAALRAARGETLIVVSGGDFTGADFRGAQLHNICFLDTRLAGSDWRGAEAAGIGFVRADLTGARMEGARMAEILLRQPVLENVQAANADFSGGRLDGGWDGSLRNLRLDRANLRGFRFDCGITLGDGCPLERAISLRGADLTDAQLSSYHGAGGDDWTGARIERTVVGLHQLEEAAAADFAGPLVVRGGEATAELTAAELRELIRHVRPLEEAAAPAFDCARAATEVERLICGDEGGRLRALDRLVANLYRRAAERDPDALAAQRIWLRERDRCLEADYVQDCLNQTYARRREALIGQLEPPEWVRPGTTALFVEPVVDFDPASPDDPLYRRLVPVLDGGAWARVAVRVNADGTLDARGEAVAANAHTCSLGAERLRLDRETGWFSAEAPPGADAPPRWQGRPVPVLLFWDDRAEVYRHGHAYGDEDEVDLRANEFASCGARAGFSELVRLPVAEAEARAAFESFGETP